MRGDDPNAAHMFSYISPEQRVPADHPLRPLRQMTDEAFPADVAASHTRPVGKMLIRSAPSRPHTRTPSRCLSRVAVVEAVDLPATDVNGTGDAVRACVHAALGSWTMRAQGCAIRTS